MVAATKGGATPIVIWAMETVRALVLTTSVFVRASVSVHERDLNDFLRINSSLSNSPTRFLDWDSSPVS